MSYAAQELARHWLWPDACGVYQRTTPALVRLHRTGAGIIFHFDR